MSDADLAAVPPSAHDAAWSELRLRSAALRRLLYACLPVLVIAYALGLVLVQPWLYPLTLVAWLAAVGWAGLRVARFACPRCGGAFFETWYYFKPLRRDCARCGLPRGAS